MNQYNINSKTIEQQEKENYIANMLVRTLYSNDVDSYECNRIVELFKEKVFKNSSQFLTGCTISTEYPDYIKRRITIG